MPVFEALIVSWQAQGYELVSLRDYFDNLPPRALPRHRVESGEVEGRAGTLAMQADEFLATCA